MNKEEENVFIPEGVELNPKAREHPLYRKGETIFLGCENKDPFDPDCISIHLTTEGLIVWQGVGRKEVEIPWEKVCSFFDLITEAHEYFHIQDTFEEEGREAAQKRFEEYILKMQLSRTIQKFPSDL